MKYLKLITPILIIIIIALSVYSISIKRELKDYQNIENNKVEKDNNEVGEDNENIETKDYDCSFTKTYRIVNTLDGYIAAVPELSYIVIDAFQMFSAFTHVIPTELKNNLEVGKYYEFTYTIKGNGTINNIDDVYNKIVSTTVYRTNIKTNENYPEPSLFVDLSIKETDKLGLGQIQENICG